MVALELGGVSVFMPDRKRAEAKLRENSIGEGPQSIAIDTDCAFTTNFGQVRRS